MPLPFPVPVPVLWSVNKPLLIGLCNWEKVMLCRVVIFTLETLNYQLKLSLKMRTKTNSPCFLKPIPCVTAPILVQLFTFSQNIPKGSNNYSFFHTHTQVLFQSRHVQLLSQFCFILSSSEPPYSNPRAQFLKVLTAIKLKNEVQIKSRCNWIESTSK